MKTLSALPLLAAVVLGAVSCKPVGPGPRPGFLPTATPTPSWTTLPPSATFTVTPTPTPNCFHATHDNIAGYYVNDGSAQVSIHLIDNETDWNSYFSSLGGSPVPTPPVDFSSQRVITNNPLGGPGYRASVGYCVYTDNVLAGYDVVYLVPPPPGTPVTPLPYLEAMKIPKTPDTVEIIISLTPVATVNSGNRVYTSP